MLCILTYYIFLQSNLCPLLSRSISDKSIIFVMAKTFAAASSRGKDESDSDFGFDDPFATAAVANTVFSATQSPQMASDDSGDRVSDGANSADGVIQDVETQNVTETPAKMTDDKFAKSTPRKETVSDIKSLVVSDAIKAKILFTGIARASNDHSCHDHPEEGRRDKWGNSFVKYYSVNTKIVFYTTSITPWESKATVESCFG